MCECQYCGDRGEKECPLVQAGAQVALDRMVGRFSSPQVGDRFEKKGAIVTVTFVALSDGSVTYLYEPFGIKRENIEVTVTKEDWLHLAEKSLEHGATFIPANGAAHRTHGAAGGNEHD